MSSGKRIVIATFGSLGDVHPYLAIGRALLKRGHRPVVATFDAFRENVEAAGVEFSAMRPSADALGDKAAIIARLFDRVKGPEYLVRGLFMPHLRESYQDLDRVCRDADLVVTHPIAFAGPLVAEKRSLPWASTVLAPLSLFSAIDPPLIDAAPWLQTVRRIGVRPYRAVFSIARYAAARWERPLHEFRKELRLPRARAPAQFEGQYSPFLNLTLFSRLLAAPQPDWPDHTVVCGFPRYDGPAPAPEVRARLEEFLAAGEPPIVFGLGSSAVMIAGDFWDKAIAAAGALGRRAILLTGVPPERFSSLPPGIRAFDYLPYFIVFPRAAAVVHQAGVGTLAQALAAGRPQLAVPVAFDQPDNARRTAALGCARVVPFHKVTADGLARELEGLLATPQYAARAAAVGEDIRGEDAANTAVDALEQLLAR
jgi:rhamnosyltransferase subunit B